MLNRRFSDFHDEIMNTYSRPDDENSGKSTGWPGLDPFYKVTPNVDTPLKVHPLSKRVPNNMEENLISLRQSSSRIVCILPQVVPGELTIITGVPNSGKSEWIDALLVNLAEQHGWSFALCSMEKKVRPFLLCLPTFDISVSNLPIIV